MKTIYLLIITSLFFFLSCDSLTSNENIVDITIKVVNKSSHIVFLFADKLRNDYEGKVQPGNTRQDTWRWNVDKHRFVDRSSNVLYAFIQDNNGNYQSYGSYGFGGDYSGDAIWVIY